MARRTRSRREEPDLLAGIREAVADPSPVALLSLVSTLMCVIDPQRHPLDEGPGPQRDEIIGSFIDVDEPETTVLLSVLAVLLGDNDLLRARIRRALADRQPVEPRYLTELSDTVTYRAVRMSHVLGDGDDIILGVRLPGGHELTAVVFIDQHMGGAVKDAFIVPVPIGKVVGDFVRETDGQGFSFDDIDLADARAWIDGGITLGSMFYPPLESETWPASRLLVQWLTAGLPEGGTGYVRPEWPPQDRNHLAQRFFASPHGVRLDNDDHRGLLESLLWYAIDYGSGDPMRWSAQRVEILFADWLPRKVMAPFGYLALAPELARAFIRFAHDEVGISPELTAETLDAVIAQVPGYLRAIDSSSAGFSDSDWHDWELQSVADAVGGKEELDRLDTQPLPDEEFDWSDIPEDIAATVSAVLDAADRCCAELLNVEYRTVCRRVLARVARRAPEAFRRRASTVTAAAAVVWIAGKGNGLFDFGSPVRSSHIVEHFGIKSSPSQRGGTFLRAAGFPGNGYHVQYGSPEYLVSSQRESLIAARDRLRQE